LNIVILKRNATSLAGDIAGNKNLATDNFSSYQNAFENANSAEELQIE
jgi:hypothetical protein